MTTDLSIGDLARLWAVAPAVVERWLALKMLPHRVSADGRYRHVTHADAALFAATHGLAPLPDVVAVSRAPSRPGAGAYSTGQLARRLRISQQSVIRAIDAGEIPGFRVPGSKFRRVREEDAEAYAKAHGLPWDEPQAEADITD